MKMSELISGEDALIALANGKDVECIDTRNPFAVLGWVNAMGLQTNLFFDGDRYKFRIKPKTITLNGVEIPAPFKPKEFEDCYMLTDLYEHGYTKTSWKYRKSIPAWRTENEIKEVVSALRNVFSKEMKDD